MAKTRPSKRMLSRSGGKSKIHKASSRQPTYKTPGAGSTSGQMSHMKNC
jgi:hypothetical protein